MLNIVNDLHFKLTEIINQGWINGYNLGTGSAGLTLEALLKIPKNNFEIADYDGIELKTKIGYFNKYISLFNSVPDSVLFAVEYIKNNYGYPDKDFNDFKVFNIAIEHRSITNTRNWKFTIKIDFDKQCLSLIVLDKCGLFVDDRISWSFQSIEEKLNRKLKYLALVDASSKKVNSEIFFKYNSFKIYKLISFDKFLKLIDQGKIRMTFKIGVFKSGKRFGQTHSHGISFDLLHSSVTELFEEVNDKDYI